MTLEAVVDLVEPGMMVALGGAAHANRPAAFVRELVRRRLTGVSILSLGAGWDLDLLVATDVTDRALVPMVSGAQHGLAPSFRADVESGKLEAPPMDAMTLIAGLLAGSYGHPYHLIQSLEGTDLVNSEEFYETLTDTSGRSYRAVRAITPDLCVLHAEESDPYGNVRHLTGRIADALEARAARSTVVFVDRLISNEEVRRRPELTTLEGTWVDAVVELPFGAHPTASAFYAPDEDHLARYFGAARARSRGDYGPYAGYLDEFVFGPVDFGGYREAVGGREVESRLRAEMLNDD
jgi:glutaconate CoA-transferase subunit A